MTKKTLLFDKHVQLGAKVVEFAGWMMPVSYSSILEEHKNVRENVGLFDVSHMGEFFVQGKDSLKFLNKLVPQDISKLTVSKAVYCQLLNNNGGIIDDLIIYKIMDDSYLIIVNASRIEEDFSWFVKNIDGFDVVLNNKSDEYSMLALQGPKAKDLIAKIGLDEDNQPKFFTIKEIELCGEKTFISRSGYTGEDGFEIIIPNKAVVELWNLLITEGYEFGLMPIGLGARDTLRLEAALPLYGNDLDENTTPVEAGLKWSIAKDKQDNYNGKQTIMEQLEHGGNKKLIGLKMLDRAIARHEYEIYHDGHEIGIITSGGVSPTLNSNIAMGYIRNVKKLEAICIGSIVQVKIREKLYNAEVIKRPFVQKKYSV